MPDRWRRLSQLAVASLVVLFLPLKLFYARDGKACLRLGRRIGRVPILGRLARVPFSDLQLTPDESVFFVTRSLLQRVFGWCIVTPVLVRDGHAIDVIAASSGSVIIASAHYLHNADMQLCIDHFAGRKVLVIAHFPETIEAGFRQFLPAFRAGSQSIVEVAYLRSDSNCLARLRSMLAEGWIVLCNVDSREPDGRVRNTVRAGIFRFAERTGTPVFASRYRLLDDASVDIDLVALPLRAVEAATAFIARQRPERVFRLDPAFKSLQGEHRIAPLA